MTKVEAIKKVIEDNSGVVTLSNIYDQIEKYYPNIKQSKEWEAGIRGVLYREIKNKKTFKRVGLSLYALQDYKEDTIEEMVEDTIRIHSFMEGICIEIGNFLKLDTYTADPSAKYNNIQLSELTTIKYIPDFTYNKILDTTKRIDVLWFNNKGFKFPKRAIEVVDSIGTLEPSLKRTLQLIEFDLSFYILVKNKHIKKVNKELNCEPYRRVRHKYIIRSYEQVLNIYKNPIQNNNDIFFNVNSHF